MIRSVVKVLVFTAATAVVFAPATARADGFFIPFAGVNFGNTPVEGNHGNFGFSAGGMGAGIIGGEFDFGYAPNIFEESVDNHVLTLTGNLIVGIPVGGTSGAGVRPYAVGGIGWMRSHQAASPGFAELNGNDFGFDLGGGVMGYFSDHFGIRGDLRYFRTFSSDIFDNDLNPELKLGSLDFWRASFGLVIR
jgi:outer membrane protein with beta-barrel domain